MANETSQAVEVKAKKLKGFSLIWTVPVLALIITTILLWQNTINTGPKITLIMDSAAGITADKTEVKFRSVKVGMVTGINITDDYQHTELTIQMNPGTEDLLNKDTRFWVVKPRVEYSSITGLDTLLSGAYVALSKGTSAEFSEHFTCLTEEPIIDTEEIDGKKITILSNLNRRARPGDPLTYRGFPAGQITNAYFDVVKQQAIYHAIVNNPYDDLINEQTQFWLHSGFEMSFGPTGFNFSTDNMRGLMQGGIDFENYGVYHEDSINQSNEYILYKNETEARAAGLRSFPLYVILFKDSIDNVSIGSKVKYRGINIGEVVEKPLLEEKDDLFDKGSFLPVLVAFDYEKNDTQLIKSFFDALLDEKKLCAELGPGSLMVPGTSIALNLYSEEKCELYDPVYMGYRVIPTIASTGGNDISSLIAKIKEFDVKGTSDDLKKSLNSLDYLLKSLSKITDQIDNGDTVKDLNAALKSIVSTLDSFKKTADSLNQDNMLSQSINDTLGELRKLLKDLSPAMREIGQKPNSLLFGSDKKDPEPGRRK